MLLAAARLACSATVAGWWRNDNDERFAEMQLRSDGQFASLSRNNAIIAIIPLTEQSGTWSLQGATLTIDAALFGTQKAVRTHLRIVSVSDRQLQVRTADGHTGTYRRLPSPSCRTRLLPRQRDISRRALVGSWHGHYRTHEARVTFQQVGRAEIRAWDPHSKVFTSRCRWQLTGRSLVFTWRDDDGLRRAEWLLDSATSDCISFKEDSGMAYTMLRTR
jgi:hypothetical protein